MLGKIFNSIIIYAKKLFAFAGRYHYVLGGIFIVVVFVFTILRISSLVNPNINQTRYNEGLLEQKKVVFDEDAIKRIDSLDKRTVSPAENIDESRNNPF
jgi:hypothetical protein